MNADFCVAGSISARTDNSPAIHPAATRPAYDDSGCKTNPPMSQFKGKSH
jgi:hypothetical protein